MMEEGVRRVAFHGYLGGNISKPGVDGNVANSETRYNQLKNGHQQGIQGSSLDGLLLPVLAEVYPQTRYYHMQGTSTSCVSFDWLLEDELVVPQVEAKLLRGMPLIITLITASPTSPRLGSCLRIIRTESI